MISACSLSTADSDEYREFLARSPAARFSHELGWARALTDTYGLPCEHVLARQDGRIVGALPLFTSRSLVVGRHLTSCPFPSYAPPLFDSVEALGALVGAVARRAGSLPYAHLACGDPLSEAVLPVELLRRSDDLTFRLPLEADPASVLARLSKNIRRDARMAEKAGVSVAAAPEGSASEEFYRLYATVYARKHGMPPHPRSLFRNLARHLGPSAARVHLARVDGRCLAAILTLRANGEVYYAWSAADPTERDLQPTTLLLFRIIEEACAEGQRVFNMGEAPKAHDALVHFKSRWCPDVREANSYYLLGTATAPPPHFFGGFGWQKKIISRLPIGLTTRFLSPLLRFVV